MNLPSYMPALLAVLAAACASAPRAASEAEQPGATLAFTHVGVVDVERGRVLPDQTVLVRGSRIRAVGASANVRVPAGVRVVDARGRYLMPGLWDMHVHTVSKDIDLPLEVANGVTGVRDMGGVAGDVASPPGNWGIRWDSLRVWRAEVRAGRLVGPRIVAAGVALDGPKPVWPETRSLSSAAEARWVVDSLALEGVDFIKVYARLPRDILLAIADEARRHHLTFAGHLSNFVTVEDAASAGQRSIEHTAGFERYQYDSALWEEFTDRADRPPFPPAERAAWLRRVHATFDTTALDSVARILVRHGTWSDPTLVQLRGFYMPPDTAPAARARLAYVPPQVRRAWENRIGRRSTTEESVVMRQTTHAQSEAVARIFHRAGVRMLAGADAWNPNVVPGFSLHDELALLVGIGMTPLEALRAATLDPARFLGATDSLGSVAPGKLADLVLLDADPLQDIRNTRAIAAVVLNGRYLDRAALDALLAGAERAAGGAAR